MRTGKSKVLHGEGEPRIVITETDNYTAGSIDTVNDNTVLLTSIGKMDVGLINRQTIATNKFGSETRAKITDYNSDTNILTIDNWNNELAVSGSFVVKNEVIDLPYCQELLSWYEVFFKPEKVLENQKESNRN